MVDMSSIPQDKLALRPCRKKPIVVHAVQVHEEFSVENRHGPVTGKPGDWLMIGHDGQRYPCDEKTFAETYELLEEQADTRASCIQALVDRLPIATVDDKCVRSAAEETLQAMLLKLERK